MDEEESKPENGKRKDLSHVREIRDYTKLATVMTELGFLPIIWRNKEGTIWVERSDNGKGPFEVVKSGMEDGFKCGADEIPEIVERLKSRA